MMSLHAVYGYFVLVDNYAAVDGADRNKIRIKEVYAVSVNPLISEAADLVVLNYLVPDRSNWRGGYCLFEGLAHSIPSYTLLDQMGFYAWYAGEVALAESVWRVRKIYYPTRGWDTLRGLFEQYYPGDFAGRWADFMALEQEGFNSAQPFSVARSTLCRGL
ncbi:hypothetical protein FQZ97_1129410 [compost metagenome]